MEHHTCVIIVLFVHLSFTAFKTVQMANLIPLGSVYVAAKRYETEASTLPFCIRV